MRRFTRSAVHVPVSLVFDGDMTIRAQTTNLSMAGMHVCAAETMSIDRTCAAVLEVDPATTVTVCARVAHRNDYGVGLEFVAIDRASFEALRELVLKYAKEPSKCDIEIVTQAAFLPPFF